jgi:SMODS and SLOG-associating 2TM effector domain 1/SMODS and SLOG-associating 2TM effector domain 3
MYHSDFPNYFQASDSASIKAQNFYLNITKIDLLSMIFASILAIYNYQSTDSKVIVYGISGILLLSSLVLTIILKTKKYEDVWYQGRALAESCKTLTWRFVCCSEYFESSLDLNEAKSRFIKRIKELSNEFKELSISMNSKILNLPIITEKMVEIRTYNLDTRIDYYIQKRIEEQKEWYAEKAEYNLEKYNFWFWCVLIAQFLSIICIVILLVNPEYNWNFVGVLTTISASALSWLQLKQHQELKQAYTTATQELNFIVTLKDQLTSEDSFSKFVLDSENAVSREHTLWLAQRRK